MYVPEITQAEIDTVKSNLDNIDDTPVKQKKHEMLQRIIESLSHRLRAKAIFRKMNYETLCCVQDTLNTVIEEKSKEASEKEEKERTIQETIEEIKQKLSEKKLSIQDLFPNVVDNITEKKPRKIKKRSILYKFHYHIFGKDYFWSGKGYLPRTLRCHLSKGHTLESCYLSKENWFTSDNSYSQKVPELFQKEFVNLLNNADRVNIPRKMKDINLNF